MTNNKLELEGINTEGVNTIDIEALKKSVGEASTLLKSLSHPDRLLLLCQIVQGQMAQKALCVQDLEQSTGIKQPSLSQQLSILRQKDLVETRREGRQIFYTMASEDALAVMEVLYQRFCSKK